MPAVLAVFGLLPAQAASADPPPQTPAVRLLVDKSERKLVLFRDSRIERVFRISLGKNPVGAKARKGDGKTPEGTFQIAEKRASERFHRGLRISYPSPEDSARAQREGYDPGSDIFIHGVRGSARGHEEAHRAFDWTDGCIAVTNDEIDVLWRDVPVGTEIVVQP